MALTDYIKRYDKHRGVNDQLQQLKRIEDDHLVNMTNFNHIPTSEGRTQLEMREGTSKDLMDTTLNITGTSSKVWGISFNEFLGGAQTTFVHNGYIYKLGNPPVILQSGVTTGKMNNFSYFLDKLIMVNDTDAPVEMAYDSAASTLAGSPPTGKYTIVFKNFVFIAGITGNLNRLQWSDLGDSSTWPAGNILDRPYGEITGLGVLYDNLYIFYHNKIEVVAGYSTNSFIFDEFADNGCISHYGIISNGSTLFFPTRDGIYAIGMLGSTDKTIGGTSLIKVSPNKIDNFWSGLDLTRDLIHGVHDPDRSSIRWSVRRLTKTVNDRELVYNYHNNVFGFSFHDGRYISCYALGKDSNNNWDVKYGDDRTTSNGGFIYRLNPVATTDDGTGFTGTIETKIYDLDKPSIDKKYHTATVLMKGSANETPLKVSYGVGDFSDYENTKTVTTPTMPLWDTAVWDVDIWEEDTFKSYPVGIRRMGKTLALKFVSDESGKRITIDSWELKAAILRDKLAESII